MSNGHPPLSTASYIIICSGRTDVLAAKDSVEKIVATNRCAAQLCSFIESNHEITEGDFSAISDLQHELMDGISSLKKQEVDTKVAEMFDLFDALEDKYE